MYHTLRMARTDRESVGRTAGLVNNNDLLLIEKRMHSILIALGVLDIFLRI